MRPRSSGTSRSSMRGGSRTAASPGAPKSLGLQFRGELHWRPAQRHHDGWLPFIGSERIAASYAAYLNCERSTGRWSPDLETERCRTFRRG